jgi:AcrR family transcriptional regulator
MVEAAIAVTAERGYGSTRVLDIVSASGLSLNGYYALFADKEACVLAALDEIANAAGRELMATYERADGPPEERVHTLVSAAVELVTAHPTPARLFLVEAYAAGPAAAERVDRTLRGVERLLRHAIRDPRDGTVPTDAVLHALVGGVRQVFQARARAGNTHELLRLLPELVTWLLAYRDNCEPPSAPPSPREASRDRPAPNDARERILWAVAEILATKGRKGLTITEIARVGKVSLTTYYAHFDSKDQVLIAAMEYGERRLLEEVFPAYQAATSWPEAVAAGCRAFFGHLSANPEMARLGGFEAFSAGAEAQAWRERSIAGFQALLLPGYESYPATPSIAAEAIAGAIATLFYDYLRDERAEQLHELTPLAIMLALVPFVGLRAALDVVSGTAGTADRPS